MSVPMPNYAVSIKIVQVPTDNRKFVFQCKYNNSEKIIPSEVVLDGEKAVRKQISDFVGKIIPNEQARDLIHKFESAKVSDEILAITRTGWGAWTQGQGPTYYAMPDGSVVSSKRSVESYIPMFSEDPNANTKGRYKTYIDGVAHIIGDLPIPTMIFFYSLTPILQAFTVGTTYFVENVIVELVGPSGSQKSTLAGLLAGSVWGGGDPKLGFARTWNQTANKIEDMMPEFHNRLLILDEANVGHAEHKSRAEFINNVLHRLSQGQKRGRLGEKDGGGYMLMALSTSNVPLQDLMAFNAHEAGAANVRLLSFNQAHPDYGYLPPKDGNEYEVSPGADLRELVTNNYGHFAKRFIEAIFPLIDKDFDGFRGKLLGYMKHFIEKLGINPNDETAIRIAKPFALTYAACQFAKAAGLVDPQKWVNPGRDIRAAYLSFVNQRKPDDPGMEVEAVFGRKDKTIVKSSNASMPDLTDAEFKAVDAFSFRVHGKPCLGFSTTSLERNFSNARDILNRLDRYGYLISNDGRQFKKRVRKRKGMEVNDRLYVVAGVALPKAKR